MIGLMHNLRIDGHSLRVGDAAAWVACIYCLMCCAGCFSSSQSSNRATETAVFSLTEAYQSVAEDAIYTFVSVWEIREGRHPVPSIEELNSIATGTYLEYLILVTEDDAVSGRPYKIHEFEISQLEVVEYSPSRMRVQACAMRLIEEFAELGDLQSGPVHRPFCGLYIFTSEDGIWKLSGFFSYNALSPDGIYQDYFKQPDEIRTAVGPLPWNYADFYPYQTPTYSENPSD